MKSFILIIIIIAVVTLPTLLYLQNVDTAELFSADVIENTGNKFMKSISDFTSDIGGKLSGVADSIFKLEHPSNAENWQRYDMTNEAGVGDIDYLLLAYDWEVNQGNVSASGWSRFWTKALWVFKMPASIDSLDKAEQKLGITFDTDNNPYIRIILGLDDE